MYMSKNRDRGLPMSLYINYTQVSNILWECVIFTLLRWFKRSGLPKRSSLSSLPLPPKLKLGPLDLVN